jgi:hypothetical protein
MVTTQHVALLGAPLRQAPILPIMMKARVVKFAKVKDTYLF